MAAGDIDDDIDEVLMMSILLI